jgi:multisubunit Na+/H+ antiporter MnhB subunit
MKYNSFTQRVIVGIGLLLFLAALLNENALHLLREYDGLAVLLSGAILALLLFSAPSLRQSLKRPKKDGP